MSNLNIEDIFQPEIPELDDPIKELDRAKNRFRRSKKEHEKALYDCLQIAACVALVLGHEAGRWREFRKRDFWRAQRKNLSKDAPSREKLLRLIMVDMFSAGEKKLSAKDSWKYARAVNRHLESGIEARAISKKLRDTGGIEQSVRKNPKSRRERLDLEEPYKKQLENEEICEEDYQDEKAARVEERVKEQARKRDHLHKESTIREAASLGVITLQATEKTYAGMLKIKPGRQGKITVERLDESETTLFKITRWKPFGRHPHK